MKKDLLSLRDLPAKELLGLIDRGLEIKRKGRENQGPLRGYTLGLLFDKASTRTRVSFETAMFRLGGHTIFLTSLDTQLSRDEPIRDTSRVLSRYLDAMAVRTYSQELVTEFAHWSEIPVINALTDKYHPCQIMSDLMTIKERRGSFEGMRVAWIGDGNNVANSWINAARQLDFELVLACPQGYKPEPEILQGAGENIRVVEDPFEAAAGSDVINTDVWASMGQEEERKQRTVSFQGFQINRELLKQAKPDAFVMHCLPAHRGEEISEETLEGERSVVFDQAENKMHMHQALLEMMLLK